MAAPSFSTLATAFTAHAPEELTEGVTQLDWESEYLPLGRDFRTAVEGVQVAGAQLVRVRYHEPMVAQGGGPPNTHIFVLARGGRSCARLGGEALHSSNVGVIRPGSEYEFYTKAPMEMMVLAVPRERVDAMALALSRKPMGAAGHATTLPLRDPCAAAGRELTWTALLESLLCPEEPLPDERAPQRSVARLLEELLCEVTEPQPPTRVNHRHEAARRAEAHLRENWRQPIAASDLCRAARVPERTLRRGFEEMYGRAPTAHLLSMRLAAARKMLRAADPEENISRIALRCGFNHLGRFSVNYRKAFGETPSQTRSRPTR